MKRSLDRKICTGRKESVALVRYGEKLTLKADSAAFGPADFPASASGESEVRLEAAFKAPLKETDRRSSRAAIVECAKASFVAVMSVRRYPGRRWAVSGLAGLVGRFLISDPASRSAMRTS